MIEFRWFVMVFVLLCLLPDIACRATSFGLVGRFEAGAFRLVLYGRYALDFYCSAMDFKYQRVISESLCISGLFEVLSRGEVEGLFGRRLVSMEGLASAI